MHRASNPLNDATEGQLLALRFGPFELDVRSGELRRNGTTVRLQPQPFKVLVLLACRPGEVVTREEIQAEVWPAGTFVDFEQSLNFCVRQIRASLGDNANAPRYLETLPRRGYRWVGGAVEQVTAPATVREWPRPVPVEPRAAGSADPLPAGPRSPSPRPRPVARARAWWPLAAALLLVAAAIRRPGVALLAPLAVRRAARLPAHHVPPRVRRGRALRARRAGRVLGRVGRRTPGPARRGLGPGRLAGARDLRRRGGGRLSFRGGGLPAGRRPGPRPAVRRAVEGRSQGRHRSRLGRRRLRLRGGALGGEGSPEEGYRRRVPGGSRARAGRAGQPRAPVARREPPGDRRAPDHERRPGPREHPRPRRQARRGHGAVGQPGGDRLGAGWP